MHIEIQVALNFVISYLYNKLPRRRVNLFGEELERALREKFNGHWYPDKPVRGSAYRCIKTGTGPVDPVLERAARESGIPVQDILENMPQELAVWVDPAEVSYRIGEKGAVRILYSEANGNLGGGGGAIGGGNNNSTTPTQISSEDDLDTEVRKTFNPDAQCFRPIQNALGNLNLGPSTKSNNGCISPYQSSSVLSAGSPPPTVQTTLSVASQAPAVSSQKVSTATVAPSVQSTVSAPGSVSPIPQTSTTSATATAPFLARPTAPPLTFTTATFAQTKFGSTKLKTSSKRANRMSPTEFSNYIKQRALQQQQQQQQQAQQNGFVGSRPRSLSPHPPAQPNQNGLPPQAGNPENYFFPGRHYLHFPAPQYHHQPHPLHSEMHFAQQQQQQQHKFPAYLDSQSHFYPSSLNNANSSSSNNSTILPAAMSPTSSTAPATSPGTTGSPAGTASSSQDGKQQLLDGLNFGLQTYQSGQYQHLLVAN